MVCGLHTHEKARGLELRLAGEEATDQLTCSVRTSSSVGRSTRARVNIIFPASQQNFASLLRLYLERGTGAEVTLGEAASCRRNLVLLPLEGEKAGLTGWLGEVGRAAARGEALLAVVEERGQWRSTDPWLEKVEAEDSVLWVHDYQEACVARIVEKLRLGEEKEEDAEEELEEEEEEVESRSRRGRELWGNLRSAFLRTRTMSVDSGYSSS
jgi:hypothetical protein